MPILYKVVREDWTSCFDGKTKYNLGEKITVADPEPAEAGACGRGLHACFRPEDAFAFRRGAWPVRLLEVETDSIIARDNQKCRCASLTVTKELPLELCFGPNGKGVINLINEIASVQWFKPQATEEKIIELLQELFRRLAFYGGKMYSIRFVTSWNAAYVAAMNATWDAARNAAWDAAYVAAMNATWDAARNAAWDAAYVAAMNATWDAARNAAWDAAYVATWDAARDAAMYAAWIVVEDLMPPNPFFPLWEIWKLGGWPIGMLNGDFVIALIKEG